MKEAVNAKRILVGTSAGKWVLGRPKEMAGYHLGPYRNILQRCKVDGNGSGSHPMAGFHINSTEPSGYAFNIGELVGKHLQLQVKKSGQNVNEQYLTLLQL
jgi:hypothetical protein